MDSKDLALPPTSTLPPGFGRRDFALIFIVLPTRFDRPRFREELVAFKRETLVKYQEHTNDICEG